MAQQLEIHGSPDATLLPIDGQPELVPKEQKNGVAYLSGSTFTLGVDAKVGGVANVAQSLPLQFLA